LDVAALVTTVFGYRHIVAIQSEKKWVFMKCVEAYAHCILEYTVSCKTRNSAAASIQARSQSIPKHTGFEIYFICC